MAISDKVIWSEGMFLQPQHFQQAERYFDNQLRSSTSLQRNYQWGFSKLVIDHHQLKLGKVLVSQCEGIMPDGTLFLFDAQKNETQLALDIPQDIKSEKIFLLLPMAALPIETNIYNSDNSTMVRYLNHELDIVDNNTTEKNVTINAGKLNLQLRFEKNIKGDFIKIPLCVVVEAKQDKEVVIDEDFIPANISANDNLNLANLLKEVLGLLNHRGLALAGRMGDEKLKNTADIADFMLLQLVNRYEPLFIHFSQQFQLHPEYLYSWLLQLSGELSTFTSSNKRPRLYQEYDHLDLQTVFNDIMQSLRQSLSMVFEQNAIKLELQEKQFGIKVAVLPDKSLLYSASFVLAVKANVSNEILRANFPAQSKIGTVEQISQLVNLQLPGIKLEAMAVAPRQIPFYTGYTYYQLDKSSEMWSQMENSGGFAFHISGNYPDLSMEFWAIKE